MYHRRTNHYGRPKKNRFHQTGSTMRKLDHHSNMRALRVHFCFALSIQFSFLSSHPRIRYFLVEPMELTNKKNVWQTDGRSKTLLWNHLLLWLEFPSWILLRKARGYRIAAGRFGRSEDERPAREGGPSRASTRSDEAKTSCRPGVQRHLWYRVRGAGISRSFFRCDFPWIFE